MCGLLPCEFWRLVVVYPHEALAFSFSAGFLVALVVVCCVQWLRRRFSEVSDG